MLWHVCSPAAGVWGLLCLGCCTQPSAGDTPSSSKHASIIFMGWGCAVYIHTWFQCNRGGCCCHPLSGDSSDSRGGRLVRAHQPQAHSVGAAASRAITRSLCVRWQGADCGKTLGWFRSPLARHACVTRVRPEALCLCLPSTRPCTTVRPWCVASCVRLSFGLTSLYLCIVHGPSDCSVFWWWWRRGGGWRRPWLWHAGQAAQEHCSRSVSLCRPLFTQCAALDAWQGLRLEVLSLPCLPWHPRLLHQWLHQQRSQVASLEVFRSHACGAFHTGPAAAADDPGSTVEHERLVLSSLEQRVVWSP